MSEERSPRPVEPAAPRPGADYAAAAVAVGLATGLAWLGHGVFEAGTLILAYVLAVVAVAARYGRGPSVAACVAGVAAFDFFFVPPYLTFTVAEPRWWVVFAVMLVVGLVIGGLTARIGEQAAAAVERGRWMAALYALSRELAQAGGADALLAAAVRHVAGVFVADVLVLLPDAGGVLVPHEPGRRFPADEAELTASRQAFERGEPCGVGADAGQASAASGLFLPLIGAGGTLGVVAVWPRRRRGLQRAESRRQLQVFVDQVATSLERIRLADEAQDARVRAQTERLRNALLTSVSHDLRTPLAAITGAATTLLDGGNLDGPTRRELLEAIRDEAERLHRLVQNLLELTRLESGTLRLQRQWHPLEEVVGAALGRLSRSLEGRPVHVSIPPDLPLVAIDDVLVEQVLLNLIDNATKYAAAGSAIRILVTAGERNVTVEVADHGPGLPPGAEDRVFDKFYRAAPEGRRGAGLGLAICRGIVQAHGGRIWAQSLPEGGTAFLFTIPLAEASPPPVLTDA